MLSQHSPAMIWKADKPLLPTMRCLLPAPSMHVSSKWLLSTTIDDAQIEFTSHLSTLPTLKAKTQRAPHGPNLTNYIDPKAFKLPELLPE